MLGNNYRMTDISATIGIEQLKRIKKNVVKKNIIAKKSIIVHLKIIHLFSHLLCPNT